MAFENQLFNRNVEFTLFARNDITGSVIPDTLITWTKNNIQSSFSKSQSKDVANSGSVTVTNITRSAASLLVSATSPHLLAYTFKAGYGDRLHLVSRGIITQATFRHGGGDISVDFVLHEGSNRLKNYGKEKAFKFTRGENYLSMMDKVRRAGVKINFIGDVGLITNRLSNAVMEDDAYIIPGEEEAAIIDYLDRIGISATIDNEQLNIYQKTPFQDPITGEPTIDNTPFRYNTDQISVLNFKTGLLNASLENSHDAETQVTVPFLSFKTLWIPTITPISLVAFNEPRYEHIKGIYFVQTVSITLNNIEGDFTISAKAINLFYKDHRGDYAKRFRISYRRLFRDPAGIETNFNRRLQSLGIRVPLLR